MTGFVNHINTANQSIDCNKKLPANLAGNSHCNTLEPIKTKLSDAMFPWMAGKEKSREAQTIIVHFVVVCSRSYSENLRWPNTVFARAFADAIQRVHKDFKKQTCRQQTNHLNYSLNTRNVCSFSL